MATLLRCSARFLVTNIKLSSATKCSPSWFQNNGRSFCKLSPLMSGRKYSDKHEWITVSGNIGTIGISQYAQEALGDIVYAQLPDPDDELDRDDECGTLESVKAASELYTPVSGKVTEKNTEVEETPALINTSCYDKGWLFKMELKDTAELEDLMDEKQYESFLKEEE